MKTKSFIFVSCFVFSGLPIDAQETQKPYVIQNGNRGLIVSNMPVSKISEPITNSFVYIDGEYIVPPYVVSISNLAVCINGRIVRDFEPWVTKRESQSRRIGITPETVASEVDGACGFYTRKLIRGCVLKLYKKGGHSSSNLNGDGGASTYIALAKKAEQGDEKARQELINMFKLGESVVNFRSNWIQRLANNTNLEVRATRILESKRLKEQKEKERREQQNPQNKR